MMKKLVVYDLSTNASTGFTLTKKNPHGSVIRRRTRTHCGDSIKDSSIDNPHHAALDLSLDSS